MNHNQSGSVLLISLVFLLVITGLGIASISGISMTEKMAKSQRDYDMAFEMAEAALLEGESWLDSYDSTWKQEHIQPDCDPEEEVACWHSNCNNALCFNGEYPLGLNTLCELDPPSTPVWQDILNWNKARSYSQTVAGAQTPKFMLEFMCYTPRDPSSYTDPPDYSSWVRLYRVTAIGFGTNPNTRVMLQSTYRTE